MTTNQKAPTGDEPVQAKGSKKGQRGPKRSNKPEPLKAQVVGMHIEGESNREIARELDIDRKTVAHIIEESADEIGQVILEAGMNHKKLVNDHLLPLLDAKKAGMYGVVPDANVILRTVKYINQLKGVGLKRADNGHPAAGVTIRLDLSPGEEAKVAAVISGRRGARQPGVGAPVHENRG